jgi:hypothetical protein
LGVLFESNEKAPGSVYLKERKICHRNYEASHICLDTMSLLTPTLSPNRGGEGRVRGGKTLIVF